MSEIGKGGNFFCLFVLYPENYRYQVTIYDFQVPCPDKAQSTVLYHILAKSAVMVGHIVWPLTRPVTPFPFRLIQGIELELSGMEWGVKQ